MNDLLLIEGLRQRRKVIFDYIFNYYYSSLCVFSKHYVNDSNQAEDLVQDFFVALWEGAPYLQIRTSLRSYLFACVKNRCLDFQKHQRIVEKYQAHVLLSSASNDNPTEQYLAESELRQVIHESINKLSPRCQEIFKLSRFNGLSNQEISEQLGISKRTVELQITNSLKILKKELVEYFPVSVIS